MQKPTWVNWRDEKWNIHLKTSFIFDPKMLSLLPSWYFFLSLWLYFDLMAYFVSKMTYVYIQNVTSKIEKIYSLWSLEGQGQEDSGF